MAQGFHPGMNTLARVSILVGALLAAGFGAVNYTFFRSSYVTGVGVAINQPVQFSHEHHSGALGIDCRYCHVGVETSAFAGIPPTETCMTCHSQIWRDSPILAPVRNSLRDNEPIKWNRVHNLPEYAYFNHSVHLNKGVGCASCHGRIDLMPLVSKAAPMTMSWCLECHREPEKNLRPKEEIFNMKWAAASESEQLALGRELVKKNHVPVYRLSDCSTCHH